MMIIGYNLDCDVVQVPLKALALQLVPQQQPLRHVAVSAEIDIYTLRYVDICHKQCRYYLSYTVDIRPPNVGEVCPQTKPLESTRG